MNRAILAIDPGTKCGWALRLERKATVLSDVETTSRYSGTWNLGTGHHRTRISSLYRKMYALKEDYALREYDFLIVFEQAKFVKHPAAQTFAVKIEATIDLFTDTYGFRIPKPVTVQEWRNYFLKDNDFLTSPKAPKEVTDKTAWYKSKTIEKCNSLGIHPETDNEADAIGILFWATYGGVERQKARQARNRDIKAQKKAQGDLLEAVG